MGSEAAFERVVARHEREVQRICRSILRDDHLGRDATQETFVKLWRQGLATIGSDQLAAWLRRVALSSSLDLSRRRDAHRRAAERRADTLGEQHQPDPLDDALDAELRARFEIAIDSLPERQRTVFLLRHDGGLRLKQVAELLGVELSTVKTQFARACWKLSSKLANVIEGPKEPK